MKKKIFKNGVLLLLFLFSSCDKIKIFKKNSIPQYTNNPEAFFISDTSLKEISGICESYNLTDHLWIHEDGPNINEIKLIDKKGVLSGKLKLPFSFRDVEDIAIGSGPLEGKNYIYLADTGDNNMVYNEYTIYRFQEPEAPESELSDKQIEFIKFTYPDGSHDTECILLDPVTNDIYLVTKREAKVGLYKLAYPQDTRNAQKATFVQQIPLTYITSGGISSDGNQIALMSYTAIFVWNRKQEETISQTLLKDYTFLPYIFLPQGEAFCFTKDTDGYYTSGESAKPKFDFYKRKK
ncbi:PE-PGRS family protein [Emticicia sp. CRIBPO]|uniref:PE-PGRS family protein n=1 Tax=Emticicia sp. CRIBPO TaxID=2683258 RepID=UPI001411F827|nr:PE-PGRS family protein [Emticicia sp. CRIBPO]NBA84748.1 PE-PGRS family protein [Emticicia sp. CRIBPO]